MKTDIYFKRYINNDPSQIKGIDFYHDRHKEWWFNGVRHREDGPAVVWRNGHKEWHLNGEFHREDGPSH